jgi:hypothetical protein
MLVVRVDRLLSPHITACVSSADDWMLAVDVRRVLLDSRRCAGNRWRFDEQPLCFFMRHYDRHCVGWRQRYGSADRFQPQSHTGRTARGDLGNRLGFELQLEGVRRD